MYIQRNCWRGLSLLVLALSLGACSYAASPTTPATTDSQGVHFFYGWISHLVPIDDQTAIVKLRFDDYNYCVIGASSINSLDKVAQQNIHLTVTYIPITSHQTNEPNCPDGTTYQIISFKESPDKQ